MKNLPKFDITSAYDKLYCADGEKEVLLTAKEADELLDYLEYVSWLLNPPNAVKDWRLYLKIRRDEWFNK